MYFMPGLSGSKPDRLHSLPPFVPSSRARYRPSRCLCAVLPDVPPSFGRATVLSVSLEMSGAYPTAQRGKRLRESLKQSRPYYIPGGRKRRALGRLRAIWRHIRDTARHIIEENNSGRTDSRTERKTGIRTASADDTGRRSVPALSVLSEEKPSRRRARAYARI